MLKTPKTRRGRIVAACTIGSLVVLVVVALLGYFLFWGVSNSPAGSDNRPAAAAPASLRPNAVDATKALFGPWHSAAPGSTGAPALVMLLQNGSIQVSSWVVVIDNTWQAGDPTLFAGISPGEQTVTCETSFGRTFATGYGQAFILEDRPMSVFAFVLNGNGSVQLLKATTEQVHLLGHFKR